MPDAEIEGHLSLLATFHHVLGGLVGLMACIPLIYVALGIVILTDAFPMENGEEMPRSDGWVIIGCASTAISLGWAIAVMMWVAGRRLRRQRSHTFCMVVAAIECLLVPLGTILGVLTIVVLLKRGAKARFTEGG